jgi:hypothetical protein
LREKAGLDLAEALAAAGLVCHTDARKVHGISCSLWHGRAAPAVIRGLIGAAGQVVPIAAPNDAESSEASAAAAPPRSDDESVEECKGGARSAGASASEGSQRDLPAEPSDDGVEMATGVASPPPEASAPPSGESVDRADIAGVASGATQIDGGDRRGPASQSRDSVGSARGRRFGRRLAAPTPDAGQPNDPPRDETIGQGSLNAEPVEEPCPAEIGVANEASVDAAQMAEGQMAECAPAPISGSAPDTATCGEPTSVLERNDLVEENLPPFLRDD